MGNLTTAQKVYLGVLLVTAGGWLGLELGIPIYEYSHGKSALTILLEHIASVLKYAVFGIVALAWLLQRIGVLPTSRPDPALEHAIERTQNPVGRLGNLTIWIVIALLLVFLFNLFDGSKDGGSQSQNSSLTEVPSPDLMSIFINWFPMLLIFGVWIFFLRQMKARQGKGTDKLKDS